jgi:hypothetical protein
MFALFMFNGTSLRANVQAVSQLHIRPSRGPSIESTDGTISRFVAIDSKWWLPIKISVRLDPNTADTGCLGCLISPYSPNQLRFQQTERKAIPCTI